MFTHDKRRIISHWMTEPKNRKKCESPQVYQEWKVISYVVWKYLYPEEIENDRDEKINLGDSHSGGFSAQSYNAK